MPAWVKGLWSSVTCDYYERDGDESNLVCAVRLLQRRNHRAHLHVGFGMTTALFTRRLDGKRPKISNCYRIGANEGHVYSSQAIVTHFSFVGRLRCGIPVGWKASIATPDSV